ncbi:YchJ family metal-binding protein [Hydrogenophaga sp. 5NK40-0174]|uniref:YchJ family protein n=1 Tax=Hydrogenophaga sp. 5NK40-0174 TaxID=3127649 RepID=UPI00310A472E
MSVASEACPCGRTAGRSDRALALADCCGRYHRGDVPAPDAESLMRSRYSAYVLGLNDYLMQTWHPDTRPESVDADPNVHWLGLSVKHHGMTGEHTADVRFVARYKTTGEGGGKAQRMEELSRFVREVDEGGVERWLYVDGDVTD